MSDPSRQPLLLSLVAGVVSAAIGVLWGLASGSRAILFDGVYGLIGIGMSAVSLMAARSVQRGQSTAFPYGRESYIPLTIGGQALLRLGVILFAALEAVLTIRQGGSRTDGLVGVVAYTAFTMLLCGVMVWRLSRVHPTSDLVTLERRGWAYATAMVGVMLVGFGAVLLLPRPAQGIAARYIDPGLVLITSLLIMPLPLRLLAEARRELLQMAPPIDIALPAEQQIRRVCTQFGLDQPLIRLTKVGGQLYVEVDHVVSAGTWDIADVDDLRRELKRALQSGSYTTWLNVDLSCDRRWGAG